MTVAGPPMPSPDPRHWRSPGLGRPAPHHDDTVAPLATGRLPASSPGPSGTSKPFMDYGDCWNQAGALKPASQYTNPTVQYLYTRPISRNLNGFVRIPTDEAEHTRSGPKTTSEGFTSR